MNGHHLAHVPKAYLLRREMESATEINRIMNDPSVFPLISLPDQKPIDVSPIITDPRFVFLVGDGCAFFISPDGEPNSGIYEIHINFLEDARGKHALEVVHEAVRWVFTHTNCTFLMTQVPVSNRPAGLMAKAAGGRLWFEKPKKWPTKDGPIDIKVYGMTIFEWFCSKPKAVIETGKRFHALLEEQYEEHKFAHEAHPEDDAHDLAVGATAEMIAGGEPEKGVILYNNWARVAGYRQIQLISKNPAVVLDIGESILHVTGDTFKVLLCRSAQG